MGLESLAPVQRFMYEYGCFVAFWSNFELLMEVAIWHLGSRSPKENCATVNPKTSGKKRLMLEALLQEAGRAETLSLLKDVFEIAERNSWIHGHIQNPAKDFSKLTLLRIEKVGGDIKVSNRVISFDISPFEGFYDACDRFAVSLDMPQEKVVHYLDDIQS